MSEKPRLNIIDGGNKPVDSPELAAEIKNIIKSVDQINPSDIAGTNPDTIDLKVDMEKDDDNNS